MDLPVHLPAVVPVEQVGVVTEVLVMRTAPMQPQILVAGVVVLAESPVREGIKTILAVLAAQALSS